MTAEISARKLRDEEIHSLVRNHSLAATAEIIAIPLPGVDVAAVFLTWARMIQQIGRAYGKQISLADARKLAWSFVWHGMSAGVAWFGSAMLAQSILKAIPVGGRVAAYLVDATIAAASIGKITRDLGERARAHFEASLQEPSEKKSVRWEDVLSRAVSIAQSADVIIRGLKPKVP